MSHKNDPWLRKRQIFSMPVTSNKKKKRGMRIFSILWLAFKKTSMVIGAAVIVSTVLSIWALSSIVREIDMNAEIGRFPSEMVLYLEIDGDLPDLMTETNFSQPFASNAKTIRNYIDALESAAEDNRVKGIYAIVGSEGLSVVHAQEFRRALAKFKESGKFAYIYATAFDQGLSGYYLASGFDEIWMQPMGVVMVSGISAQMPYLRKVLDRVGVYPQIYKRKEYKGAYDMFTESEMSKDSRRATEALVEDIALALSQDISNDMGITTEEFKTLIDKGLYMDNEALEAGLIDVLDYEDVLIEKINKQVTGDVKGDGLEYVRFDRYVGDILKKQNNVSPNDPKIALIYAIGAIVDSAGIRASGSSSHIGLGMKTIVAADEISAALLDIAEDETYKGVVLRIDSPGGSPVASETILRAIHKVQEAGKSVTVSMGSTAASGGYWIATSADKIFVLPTTITGSIGVLGGKFSLAQLWKTLGVHWDEVNWGKRAAMWSMNQPYNKGEIERVNAMMDNVYINFIARVAKGRSMSVEEVEEIARGRVWSGKRAVDIGLADEIGSLNDALDYAASQVGEADRHDIAVEIVPKPLTPIEQLAKFLEEQVSVGQALHIQAGLLHSLWPQIRESLTIQNMLSGKVVVYEPTHVFAQ
ncbi:MAG: signal peptide peptidase SppA [Alphaproteobacteria bacterium]|nr:signal peptide peptidase SppA [Alphaproteobacteria bacterium]